MSYAITGWTLQVERDWDLGRHSFTFHLNRETVRCRDNCSWQGSIFLKLKTFGISEGSCAAWGKLQTMKSQLLLQVVKESILGQIYLHLHFNTRSSKVAGSCSWHGSVFPKQKVVVFVKFADWESTWTLNAQTNYIVNCPISEGFFCRFTALC
jgi:hypothetical protein